jgi:hypothetical protein
LSLSALQDLSAITVPQEAGQILEVWQPEGSRSSLVVSDQHPNDQRPTTNDSPTVILLQDLHTQPDAQRAEARILEHLATTYRIRRVASEGAWTPVDGRGEQSKIHRRLPASIPDQIYRLAVSQR